MSLDFFSTETHSTVVVLNLTPIQSRLEIWMQFGIALYMATGINRMQRICWTKLVIRLGML